ncbi:MAG TPA: hypothetical protein VH813_09780 [Candidatus Limnocylindrales bacterium]|jgi:hypothetical protein
MERTPLVCAVCDAYLTLDDPVVGYGWRPPRKGPVRPPRFVHPRCDIAAPLSDPNLIRLGVRPLREFVLEHLRDRGHA